MNTKLENLRKFLEGAHLNGTDCVTAEEKLAEAKTLLHEPMTQDERSTLKNIITELEQVHNLCSLPNEIMDDDALCGV